MLRLTLRALLVGVLASVALAGDSTAGPFNPDRLAPDQILRVGQICTSVIGVQPGEEHYDSCVASLSTSVRRRTRARALQSARSDCGAKGLTPDTPGMAECVLRSSASGQRSASSATQGSAIDPSGGRPEAVPAKSYFAASPGEMLDRERLSCAELGLDPTTSAFASCVSDLRSALFAADNPM